jgi:hypothetical protein
LIELAQTMIARAAEYNLDVQQIRAHLDALARIKWSYAISVTRAPKSEWRLLEFPRLYSRMELAEQKAPLGFRTMR